MENYNDFWNKNKGIILGVAIAVILLITGLRDLVIGLVLIFACGFIGDYIYKNKNDVKERLKNLIDRL